jgi:WXG100 family type VII secretion target
VELTLDTQAARRAQADVLRIGDELRHRRARVSARVADLVTQGWSGVAAAQYAEGWQEWSAGAEQLLRALTTLGDLMGSARVMLDDSDVSAAHLSTALVTRLGDVR